MPTKSPAQERLMQAAAHTPGGYGGVPQNVGKEFVQADDAKMAAAGVAMVAPDGKVLFLKRGDGGDHAGEWSFPGGGLEQDETPRKAARREAREETGFSEPHDPDFDQGWQPIHRATNGEGVDYTTFLHPVGSAFEPKLNDENVAHAWAPLTDAPEPLHPGVKSLVDGIAAKLSRRLGSDSLAFDRASASMRTEDKDGHLFVEMTPISKANVCPYRGSEIPEFEALGLEPDTIYQLLRDPEELAKAAPTFRGKPLLIIHKPVNADDHPREITVGSVGTEVEFKKPYLMAPLSVWDGEGIALIDSGEQKQLSSSYHYRADMTPGTYEGEKYDGVMRDISGNHVALVKEGRAGPDVVVSDSKEGLNMSKKIVALTRKAALAQGAVIAYLAPKLAADAKIDLTPLFTGVTAKNFADKKAGIVTGVKDAAKGKLAKDANLDDVAKVIDMLDGVTPAEDAEEDTPRKRIGGFLKDKLSAEDLKACDDMWGDPQEAMDAESKEAKKEDEGEEKKAEKAEDEEPPVTKKAMDAAIKVANRSTEERMRANFKAVRDAEDAVRPYVGKLAVACDSADQIYRTALTGLGVAEDELKEVPLAGLKVILKQIPVPGSKKVATDSAPAMDTASVASFHDMFPDAKTHRVGTL